MSNKNIVVIGGYGHVGRMICEELALEYPGKVYAAGRSMERAVAFSQATQGKVQPMQLNINEPNQIKLLSNTKLVIMCLDQQNTSFVQSLFALGIHYLDISADYSFLSQTSQFHQLAKAHNSTAVLSVGLVPGLSNLLSRHTKEMLDSTEAIHISLMLGLGDAHGDAAIKWTIDNLRYNFTQIDQGREISRISFTDGRDTDFGSSLGRRTAYRFNFADQHILLQTLQVPSVSTRLCFDNATITSLLAAFKRIGIVKLLDLPWIQHITAKALSSTRIGKPMFALKIDALGLNNNRNAHAECFVQGVHEDEVTAKVATLIAQRLISSDMPHGVYHIEELFDFVTFEQVLYDMIKFSSRLHLLKKNCENSFIGSQGLDHNT